MERRLSKLAEISMGWVNYFGITDNEGIFKSLDGWVRRRLRACLWNQWKRIKTKVKNLVKLGISKAKAWQFANSRKGYWRISRSPILQTSITNKHLENLGFRSLVKRYHIVH